MAASAIAKRITEAILTDLDSRSGMDLCQLDEVVLKEIRETWCDLIDGVLSDTPATCGPGLLTEPGVAGEPALPIVCVGLDTGNLYGVFCDAGLEMYLKREVRSPYCNAVGCACWAEEDLRDATTEEADQFREIMRCLADQRLWENRYDR